MKISLLRKFAEAGLLALLAWTVNGNAAPALLGWNNLGMHCMDSDYSVFSILPPYNTIEAQLVVNGQLVTSGAGYTITYQAIADPSGSLNSTAVGKGNFYTYTPFLYGTVAPDMGLAGWAMPGLNNTPQMMRFEAANQPAAGVTAPVNWFRAEGIPISPFDDARHKNEYPMMRLTARDSANGVVATTDIVLPVSDEMDCRACHASGTQVAARPAKGWVGDANPERDYRLNILSLHDERQFAATPVAYASALAARGFNAAGLLANVTVDHKPILCAACHLSEALQGSGLTGVPPLTASIHSLHGHVLDPVLNVTLDNSANRAACYRCHPGSTTKCLRGAMGSAIAADGSMEMQCQSCHGNLSQVGSSARVGWFMEPNCQSCHTGTAAHNNGQIRYTSAFTDANGTVRVPVDQTFATTPNTPAAGLSLYRFSVGHGGLQCSACHGSTHAEFPSSHPNDNVRNIQLQGHVGVTSECTVCHNTVPNTANGGPHGMHPIGASWVSAHPDLVEQVGRAQCQSCHGVDYRGTVLSRAQGDRSFAVFGTQTFFRGATIGCYTCHNGPGEDSRNSSAPPTVANVSASTAAGQPVAVVLPVTGANATLRIISQPVNGSVGLANQTATYFPNPGFVGTDTFKFAAYDGAKNSTLATGTIVVGGSTGGSGSFANSGAIIIPSIGSGSPYPSPISVSGVSGKIAKVTVSVNNFSHTWPDDVGLLLVSPAGQRVLLMSNAGGGNKVANVTLTFDDASGNVLPDSGQIVTGSYRPAAYGTARVFPAPAPGAPFGATLSVLNGSDPNGTWSLYVADNAAGDSGSIAGGWSLNIATGTITPGTVANTSPVVIPSIGKATPYPSVISVSGIAGNLLKLTATINGLSHTWPNDVGILLVGPGGQGVVLMANVGAGNKIANVTLTFDDAAAGTLPVAAQIVSGTYKPTVSGVGKTFGSPAPAGPYGSTLSAFNGVSPNGNWSLYVLDDAASDSGTIASGWSLSFLTGASALATLPVGAPAPSWNAQPLAEASGDLPRLLRLEATPDGASGLFRLECKSALTTPTVIEASTDLLGWFPIYTNAPGQPQFQLQDPFASSSSPRRFYRLRGSVGGSLDAPTLPNGLKQ